MNTFFLALAVIGGSLLLLQFLGSLFGLGGHHDAVEVSHGHLEDVGDALNLTSVRALSAGAAFFGLTGSALLGKLPLWIVIPIAGVVGLGAMIGVAMAMRSLMRLEHDGTPQLEGAVGTEARVYLRIPGNRAGAGKVTVLVQGRMLELRAVTPEDELPTGAAVTVVDVIAPDTVEVVRTPTMKEILDGSPA
jgi:hypothetical protein